MIRVMFVRSHRMYNAGETAGFAPEEASRLIAAGVAVDAEALAVAESAAAEAEALAKAEADAKPLRKAKE